jgi:ABC-type bacteriocin/lantibiotic exporter with double-glycine peptidase domain
MLDGKDLGANMQAFQQYIAYVPQDDLLFAISVYMKTFITS